MDKVDRWTEANGWEEAEPMPTTLGRNCAVADIGNNRIYVAGGKGRSLNYEVFYYDLIEDTLDEELTYSY